MPKIKCPGCERPIGLKESHFGRKLKCQCGQVFRVPDKPATRQAPPAQQQQQLPPIQFSCPSCMTMLQVGAESAGQLSACPCGAHVPVPSANDPLGLPASDPFAFTASNQMGGQTATLQSSIPPNQMMSPYSSPPSAKKRKKKKRAPEPQPSGNSLFEGEILGGIAMMVGAVVWLGVGLAAGYIFFYPPILFLIGLGTLIKGLMD